MAKADSDTTYTLVFTSSPNDPLAWTGGQPISLGKFRDDVAHLLRRLRDWEGDVLISVPGRYGFSVALLATWLADKAAILPHNAEEHALADIRRRAPLAFECDAEWGASLEATDSLQHGRWEIQLPADKPAVYLFTSGSTGKPKAIPKSIGNLIAEAITLRDSFKWPPGAILASVPPQHMYGLTFSVMLPWVSDSAWVDSTPFFARDVLQMVKDTRAGVLISVPAQYKALLEESPTGLGDVQCVSAAAPLDGDTARQWRQTQTREILEIFGSTETGVIGYRRPASDELWQALDSVRVSQSGELLNVKSPFVSTRWPDGIQTSDRVRFEGQGRFHLLGRNDAIVKIAGKRVSLIKIETAIRAVPGVKEAAVIDAPASGLVRDRIILAAIVRYPSGDLSAKEIRSALRSRLDGVEIPRRILFVDELPRSATGKLPRQALMQFFDLDDTSSV